MALLTPAQRERIEELIQLHHNALVVELLGDKAVSKSTLSAIKAHGLYRPAGRDALRRAFQFGQQGILDSRVLRLTDAEFERYLKRLNVDLDDDDREAVDMLRRSLAAHIKTLAEGVDTRVGKALLKADQELHRKLRGKRRRHLLMEVERRKAISDVARDLAEGAEENISKATRTIHTETNNAYQEGRAVEIIKKAGGDDPDVFKRPRPDACDDCKKAYLEEDGITPRVFKLSALVDNGSNIGKSRGQRQPVVDSFHPFCACEMQHLPPGFGFSNGAMVYVGTKKSA